ncbi:hypothetical protein BKA70DRAFT_1416163 [Coprinopsis sp. MPI-PUGE-AT-0042]|nr:hypothetical protein BKA70DRAFT_1416163 [Coprinopsis sp. MPI-PUGE-AT-0042]
MVLQIVETVFRSQYFPRNYVVPIAIGIIVCMVIRAFARGKTTTRERNLHARTILVTGGFTPLGLTLLQSVAERGAHIIALSPDPVDTEHVSIIIDLLRTTTKNEQIYAEHCDLESPHSIRDFCTKFLTGKEQRLDAILFMHEYKHVGALSWLRRSGRKALQDAEDHKARERGSLASFLITTLLLPALLVAPVERDIRIINVVNPFYAAAAGPSFHVPSSSFSSSSTSSKTSNRTRSIIVEEGTRSLRSIILTRHLQRILDALPNASKAQIPKAEEGSSTVPVVSPKLQRSNIVAVTVSPGISRVDTISQLLNADLSLVTGGAGIGVTVKGVLVYLLLQPILRLVTKTPANAMQTILHALFLPTPFKHSGSEEQDSEKPPTDKPSPAQGEQEPPAPAPRPKSTAPLEVLKPGALYRECAVVQLKVPTPTAEQLEQLKQQDEAKSSKKKSATNGKAKAGKSSPSVEEVLDLEQDEEYGGEVAGRLVWEAYEDALKIWEKSSPAPPPAPEPPKASSAGTSANGGPGLRARTGSRSIVEVAEEDMKDPYA